MDAALAYALFTLVAIAGRTLSMRPTSPSNRPRQARKTARPHRMDRNEIVGWRFRPDVRPDGMP
jgi:hypothetical protein